MNGARYRLSAVTAGLFMFIIILVARPLIEIVPISSLTGVLFMVVIHTFNWDCLRLFLVIPITESFGIVLVTVLAVLFDLVGHVSPLFPPSP
jgi:SulP family sulfate permease